jgi:hypothetical protein
MKPDLWITSLHDSDGKVVAEIVLHEERLIEQALHGSWTVDAYRRIGPLSSLDSEKHKA